MCPKPDTPKAPDPVAPPAPPPAPEKQAQAPKLRNQKKNKDESSRTGTRSLRIDLNTPSSLQGGGSGSLNIPQG